MLDIKTKILFILLFFMPYKYLGFNFGNVISIVIVGIYLFKKKINIRDKFIFYALSFLGIYSLIHTIIFNRTIEGVIGTGIYVSYLLMYLLCEDILGKYKKEEIFEFIVNTNVIGVVVFCIMQGIHSGGRLNGSIGYANTYALILLVAIYMNNLNDQTVHKNMKSIILYIGILFTGSRTTLILGVAFIIIEKMVFKEKVTDRFIDLFMGVICYILIRSNIMIFLLAGPLVYVVIKKVYEVKNKKIIGGALLCLNVMMMMFIDINTFERLKNITLTNGSLQERLIMFEDGIKSILANPFGKGIGNYRYDIQATSSAYYTGEYIHNSVLQFFYDLGVIGGGIVLALFAYMIIKNISKKKFSKELVVIVGLVMHSMVNFDFSFSVIVFLFLILSNSDREHKEEKFITVNTLYISTIVLAIFICASYFEVKLLVSGYSLNSNKQEYTIENLEKLDKSLDKRIAANLGKAYLIKFDIENDKNMLSLAISNLNEAYKNDFNAKRNIVYAYKKSGNTDKAIEESKKIIEKVKYCALDYKYLGEISNSEEVVDWIEKTKNEFRKSINTRAKYIKNQI